MPQLAQGRDKHEQSGPSPTRGHRADKPHANARKHTRRCARRAQSHPDYGHSDGCAVQVVLAGRYRAPRPGVASTDPADDGIWWLEASVLVARRVVRLVARLARLAARLVARLAMRLAAKLAARHHRLGKNAERTLVRRTKTVTNGGPVNNLGGLEQSSLRSLYVSSMYSTVSRWPTCHGARE